MLWVPVSGSKPRGRPQQSFSDNLRESDVEEPKRLLDILRKAVARITDLERKVPDEATEFEVNVVAGTSSVTLNHGLTGPVRFYMVWWQSSNTANQPHFAYNKTSSKPGILVLNTVSNYNGTAVVRVEPSKNSPTVF